MAQLTIVNFPVTGGSAGLNSTLFFNMTHWANGYLCVPDSDIAGGVIIYTSYLGAPQARIVLQLALATGLNTDEMRDLFESPLPDVIYA
ncbi:hypothetical protein OQA88_11638 [Cercophora sp. LCS_1]